VILHHSRHPDLADIRAANERARRHRIERGLPATVEPGPVFRRLGNVVIQIVVALHAFTDLPPVHAPQFTTAFDPILPAMPIHAKALQVLAEQHQSAACGLFKWRYSVSEHDAREMEWLLSFYDEAIFRVWTAPAGKTNARSGLLGHESLLSAYIPAEQGPFKYPYQRHRKAKPKRKR
jgi:hypothetical protein